MISNKAIIDIGAKIGENTYIWHFTHIRSTVKIGIECTIGSHCYIDREVVIGDKCRIQSGCFIYHPALIGNEVFIGPGTIILNDKYPKATVKLNNEYVRISDKDWVCKQVIIKNRVSIGAGCILMPGITIGENSIVGAGSVVTKDVKSNSTVYGVPAK